jgi:hypothetical protein
MDKMAKLPFSLPLSLSLSPSLGLAPAQCPHPACPRRCLTPLAHARPRPAPGASATRPGLRLPHPCRCLTAPPQPVPSARTPTSAGGRPTTAGGCPWLAHNPRDPAPAFTDRVAAAQPPPPQLPTSPVQREVVRPCSNTATLRPTEPKFATQPPTVTVTMTQPLQLFPREQPLCFYMPKQLHFTPFVIAHDGNSIRLKTF